MSSLIKTYTLTNPSGPNHLWKQYSQQAAPLQLNVLPESKVNMETSPSYLYQGEPNIGERTFVSENSLFPTRSINQLFFIANDKTVDEVLSLTRQKIASENKLNQIKDSLFTKLKEVCTKKTSRGGRKTGRQKLSSQYKKHLFSLEQFLIDIHNLPNLHSEDLIDALEEILSAQNRIEFIKALEEQKNELKLLSFSRFPEHILIEKRKKLHEQFIAHFKNLNGYLGHAKQLLEKVTAMGIFTSAFAINIDIKVYASIHIETILQFCYKNLVTDEAQRIQFLENLLSKKTIREIDKIIETIHRRDPFVFFGLDHEIKTKLKRNQNLNYDRSLSAPNSRKSKQPSDRNTKVQKNIKISNIPTTIKQAIDQFIAESLQQTDHDEIELNIELFKAMRKSVPLRFKNKFNAVFNQDLKVRLLNLFLKLLDQAPKEEIPLIVVYFYHISRKDELKYKLEELDPKNDANNSNTTNDIGKILPQTLGDTPLAKTPKVHTTQSNEKFVTDFFEAALNCLNNESFSVPETAVLSKLVRKNFFKLTSSEFKALQIISEKHGLDVTLKLFTNPSFLKEGYELVSEEEDSNKEYLYDHNRVFKLFNNLIHALAICIENNYFSDELAKWLTPHNTNIKQRSFVRENRDWHNLSKIKGNAGWIQEFCIATKMKHTNTPYLIWNESLDVKINPDAVDKVNKTIFEILSFTSYKVRLNSETHLSKRKQLKRYKEYILNNRNSGFNSVELIVVGKLDKLVEKDFLEMMQPLRFSITYYNYTTFKKEHTVRNYKK